MKKKSLLETKSVSLDRTNTFRKYANCNTSSNSKTLKYKMTFRSVNCFSFRIYNQRNWDAQNNSNGNDRL